jgi:hypothetical protein
MEAVLKHEDYQVMGLSLVAAHIQRIQLVANTYTCSNSPHPKSTS